MSDLQLLSLMKDVYEKEVSKIFNHKNKMNSEEHFANICRLLGMLKIIKVCQDQLEKEIEEQYEHQISCKENKFNN